jgi:hypothetical protein
VNLDPKGDDPPKDVEMNKRTPLRDKAWHIVDMKRAVHSAPKRAAPSVPIKEKPTSRGKPTVRPTQSTPSMDKSTPRGKPSTSTTEKPAAPSLATQPPVVRRDTKPIRTASMAISTVHQMAKKFDPNHQPKKTIND